ncbi:MAG: hypothetical protein OEQ12_07680 [Nitrosopumilus sp.]|nr:hypothetical protein [Nitrosopumilus sp.]
MQNEQCGKCWDFEFDKKGNKTHDLRKDYHNFVPLDFCILCKETKFDQYGFQTHTTKTHIISEIQKMEKDHKFVSGIETQYRNKRRRKNRFLVCFVVFVGVSITAGLVNLI